MTSPNDQIRALIAEIDATLEKPSGFLGRLSGEGAKNRDTLEHLRDYLLNLQSSMRKARIRNPAMAGDLASLLGEATLDSSIGDSAMGGAYDAESQDGQYYPSEDYVDDHVIDGEAVHEEFPMEMGSAIAGDGSGVGNGGLTYAESAALIQQLGNDLEQLRAGLMAPLQAEVNQLQHQRQMLAQEVQQLQQQRSGAQSEQLLQEFLQTLMTRLQERLVAQVTAQVAQALQGMPQISGNTVAALPGEGLPAHVTQSDQLQVRAEAMLSSLDSTLKVFSTTLEQNIQDYQHSLAQGLERMQHMGSQGEVLMADLVNRLADQMEAQGSIQWDELTPAAPRLSIGGDSPMQGQTGQMGQVRQLSSGRFARNPIALDGPELTLDSVDTEEVVIESGESTSSAGIARRRILAAQDSEQRAQQSLELDSRRKAVRGENSLEDFYASVGAPEAAQKRMAQQQRAQQRVAQQQAMAVQNRGNLSRPGAAKGHYRNLEDALFDGIPEGDNPWSRSKAQGQPPSPRQLRAVPNAASRADDYPPQSHRIQALTDLVDRRFDDFSAPGDGSKALPEAFAAFYGDRTAAPRQGKAAVKKKPFLNFRHPPKSA